MALLPQPTRRQAGALGRHSNIGETGPGVVEHTPGEAGAPTGSKKRRPHGQVINGVARASRPNKQPGKALTPPSANKTPTRKAKPGGNSNKTLSCG
eukprot:3959127-Amphidinium_carterae.1